MCLSEATTILLYSTTLQLHTDTYVGGTGSYSFTLCSDIHANSSISRLIVVLVEYYYQLYVYFSVLMYVCACPNNPNTCVYISYDMCLCISEYVYVCVCMYILICVCVSI